MKILFTDKSLWYQLNKNEVSLQLLCTPIRLAKFERNFTKRNFYFITHFMSKGSFYFETERVTQQHSYEKV